MNIQEETRSPLSKSKAKTINLSEIQEIFPAGLFILNEEEKILDVNKLGLSLIGRSKEEILNSGFSDLIDESSTEYFREKISRSLIISEPQVFEIKIKGTSSNYFHALAVIKSELNSDTHNRYFTLALIDFTSYKMKEEIIRDSETRFEQIANNAPVMIWIADVEGLFSFVNKVWLDYSGKKIGDGLGMNWLRDVHPEELENLLHIYRDAFKLRKSFTFEFRLKGMNDKYEWMMIKGTPRLNQENNFTGFIGSCTNINSQKEFEEKIKKINNDLTEINASKDKFFSIISHDLRSPLGGLMGILDILSDSYYSLEEDEKLEIVNEAASAAKQTYALTENLLEWSRIHTGKMPFDPEKVELFHLIKRLDSLYSQTFKNKKVKFSSNIEGNVYVFADLKMTETILRNLISNAIKFTHPEGTISISADLEKEFLVIKVQDTGIGIDEETLDKLFRPDINYSTRGTAKEPGSGLGLILCKELVEKQGGKIWVESKKNIGTTFYFTLPVK